jgi:hypothetical protein
VNEHDLLLRAALLTGPEAVDCWRIWRESTSVAELDRDAQWLLPMLYRNLSDHGVPERELVRYAGVYRHHWYRNLLQLRRAEVAEGVRGPVLFGGAAIALERPDRLGARPFETVDAIGPGDRLLGDPFDAEFIARARTLTWRHRTWSVLDPADHLVLVCLRRELADRRSSLLWLVDAASLISLHADLDWGRVADLADRLGCRPRVQEALGDVQTRCGVGSPFLCDDSGTPR